MYIGATVKHHTEDHYVREAWRECSQGSLEVLLHKPGRRRRSTLPDNDNCNYSCGPVIGGFNHIE